MHAGQASKTVKAALHTKFANGLHIGAYAPIGYMHRFLGNGAFEVETVKDGE